MSMIKRLISLVLAVLTVFALAACGSAGGTTDGGDGKQDGKNDKNNKNAVVISDPIKAAMEANNALTMSSYFLCEDGTVISLGGGSEKRQAGVYAQLPNVRKLIKAAGLSSFALTDNNELYYENRKTADNVSLAAYCTTNSNVEGYCVIDNDIRRIDSYANVSERSYSSEFKNFPSGETASGDIVFIEVDKHDFIVLNSEGKFFTNWSSEEYTQLDYTGFEDLAIVDIAKYMSTKLGGGIESLTVAGVKGDGTVVATGTYAADILSWGKLADLAMCDGIIVGLTVDGKLKMTGDYAPKMKDIIEGWTNIVAIEAGHATGGNIDHIFTAVDSNGVFYFANIMNLFNEPETGTFSADKVNDGCTCRKYTPDGKEYYTTYEGNWEENIDG